MNSIRGALSSLVLTAGIGFAQPAFAANEGAMASARVFTSPTAAGSVPATASPQPVDVMAMCRSDAEAQGGKPAFGGMQMSMGAMMMSSNSLDLSPAQRQKIEAMMHDSSTRTMQDLNSVLTPAQQAQMAAEMRQLALPGS